jgi:Icc-related predicted phosphoesterase
VRAIRVAAAGDLHVTRESVAAWRHALASAEGEADVLLLAGDLTQNGLPAEADAVVEVLGALALPIVAVLGNHDLHSNAQDEVRRILERRGVQVLECGHVEVAVRDTRLGVAGTIGFGGGFLGAYAPDFGELEMKAFAARSRRLAEGLVRALQALATPVRIALTHYAPTLGTVVGERPEMHPFLGSDRLGAAIDVASADLAVHGHAHHGAPAGATPGGVPVRNVAQSVIGAGYLIFECAPREPRRVASSDATA